MQEVRAKRALDRLALLARPRARVLRDGAEREVRSRRRGRRRRHRAPARRPGRGRRPAARGARPPGRRVDPHGRVGSGRAARGRRLQSGSYCVAGSGIYEAERVGADAYANELTGVGARGSPRALAVAALDQPAAAPDGRAHDPDLDPAPVRTARARRAGARGRVDGRRRHRLARPRGARAAGEPRVRRGGRAGRSARRAGAAAAGRRGARRARRRVPRQDRDAHRRHARGRGDPARSPGPTSARCTRCSARSPPVSARATRRRMPCTRRLGRVRGSVTLEVPFSSRWKWSGIAFDDGSELVLGAPEVLVRPEADPELAHGVGTRQDRNACACCCSRAPPA